MTQYISKYKKIIFIIIFFLIFCFLFTYKITDVPPGINGDEASIGYNAILISQTLRDENHRLLPIFFLTMGGRDWKQPVTIYTTAILFKIFGPSYFLLRGVSVFIVITSAILLFLLLKQLFNFKLALCGLFVFLTTPIIIIQSHLALENIALLPFIIFWLWMIIKYEQNKQSKMLIWGGISLGLSLYSYNGMRLIAPVFFIMTIGYILFLNKNFLKEKINLMISSIGWFCCGILPFIILMFVTKFQYPGAIFGSARPVAISSYQQFLLPFLSSFDLSFLFLQGDSTTFHSTGLQGMFLVSTLIFFIVGSYVIVLSKRSILIFILLAFFLSPILFGFVNSVHRGSRLLAIVPFYTIIVSIGIFTLLQLRKKILGNIIFWFLIMIMFLNICDFMRDYWFDYPSRARIAFPSVAHIAYKNLYEQSQKLKINPAVQADLYAKEGIGAVFLEAVYFPNGLKKFEFRNGVPEDGIVLTYSSDASLLEKEGFKKINIKMPDYAFSYK